jgi:hypothetical protein
MTEKTGSPAPAVVPNAPAVESPAQRPEVDLSDLQAEQDAASRKAEEDEVFDDINKAGDKEVEAESDEDDAETDEEAADEAEEEESDDTEEAKPKKSTRADRYKVQRERLIRLEAENAQLRSRAGGSLSTAQLNEHVESVIGAEPQEKDFESYLDYEREKTAWLLDKRQVMRETVKGIKQGQQERARQMQENVERHQERVEEFRTRNGDESVKDFDSVMAKAKDMLVSPTVEELILESDKSAHLQYFFARNPQRLEKINRMDDRTAAREIGHIEARLSLPQAKTKSAAPPPKRSPKGGVGSTSPEAELDSWLTKKYGNR